MRVLVAEDHERLARAVAAGLRRYGMVVDVALDGDVPARGRARGRARGGRAGGLRRIELTARRQLGECRRRREW